VYAAEWKTLISTAWEIDPKLAVRLAERFRNNAIPQAEITRMVQADPGRVYDLPEAVVYLVTEDAVKKAAFAASETESPLRHLIYWTPTTLPTAIWFLNPPFCQNRRVLEYAVHSLRAHPAENVLFYLSQILQCLRNDSEDKLLYNFLLEASKASVLLSHQLLWLSQAELGEVKREVKFAMTPFRYIVKGLIADVIDRFDEVEQQFFQQEFEFFEQITAISGILKPIPTKLDRKAKIAAELAKIKLTTKNIYLPTNPQLQVQEIICSSGSPMQSAAKVPILVAFKVRVGELDLSSERALCKRRRKSSTSTRNAVVELVEEKENAREEEEEAEDEEKNKATAGEFAITVDAADGIGAPSGGDADTAGVNGVGNAYADVSRLDAEEIDLLVGPETSESSASVRNYQLNTAVAKDSAAKLAAAKSTADEKGLLVQACIFKVGDGKWKSMTGTRLGVGAGVSYGLCLFVCLFLDCRQDALALQVIQWCKNIMAANGLELFLYPYRVLPNRTGGNDGLIGGIIECVPNANTRDEIGKSTASSLKDYFISRFGPEESESFQKAQRNWIVSCAGYAVTSYILQVKDRHNGNVMVDDAGHMIHIDFGFIFDISPARNMRFESAGFKLTQEMVELMGSDGKTESALYKWFQYLVVRGFLAVREHRSEILAIVEPMLNSTLVCFNNNSLNALKERFFPERDERVSEKTRRDRRRGGTNNKHSKVHPVSCCSLLL
jgi:phosphatidylinositol 4-kinase